MHTPSPSPPCITYDINDACHSGSDGLSTDCCWADSPSSYYNQLFIDWLDLSLYGAVAQEAHRVAYSRLEEEAFSFHGRMRWTAPDGTVYLVKHTKRQNWYRLRLYAADGVIIHLIPYVSRRRMPWLRISFPAVWCRRHGLQAYAQRVQQVAASLGFRAREERITRLDICTDLPLTVVELMHGRPAGTGMRRGRLDQYFTEDVLTGLHRRSSKGAMAGLSIYDKRLREQGLRRVFWRQLWHDLEIDPCTPITRVEARLKTKGLHDRGICRLEELTPDAVNRAWSWFSEFYFRIVEGSTRRPTPTVTWEQVQACRYKAHNMNMCPPSDNAQPSPIKHPLVEPPNVEQPSLPTLGIRNEIEKATSVLSSGIVEPACSCT